MSGYLEILRSPAGRLVAVSGFARFAWGIEGLGLVFHVEEAADSYASAGLALAALGVFTAVLAPWRGLLVDRHGRRALLTLALAAAALLVAIALVPPAGPGALSLIVLAGLTGVVAPPFTGWTRAALAARLQGEDLRKAFTIDNVFEESAFVVGPLVAAVVIAVASPGAALVVAAGLIAAGALGLGLGELGRNWAPPSRDRTETARASLNRRLALTFACLGGMGAGVGFFEVAVAAFADAEGARSGAGLAFAALSIGGISGAFVYGARAWPGSVARQYAALLALVGTGLLALALPETMLGLVVVTAVTGLAFTPVFIANSLLIEQLSPGGPGAVSFAWVTTAMNGGFALGAAVCGALVETLGTDPAFAAAGFVVLASAGAALAIDPRGRTPAVTTASPER